MTKVTAKTSPSCQSSSSSSSSGGDAVEHYRGEVDVSGGSFPEVGGVNDLKTGGGRPTRSDYYLTTTTGPLLDRSEVSIEVPAGSMLYYTGADDGNMQLGANWKINQG